MRRLPLGRRRRRRERRLVVGTPASRTSGRHGFCTCFDRLARPSWRTRARSTTAFASELSSRYADLVGHVAVVDVHRHAAQLERGEERLEVLGPVREVDRDLVAGLDAGRGLQVPGQAAGPVVELRPASAAARSATSASAPGRSARGRSTPRRSSSRTWGSMLGRTFRWISGGSGEDALGYGSSEGSVVNGKPRFRRGVVTVVGFVALAVVPVLGLNSLATADTGDTGAASAADGQRHPRPALTDAQRQCLAEQGVTLPTRPADGHRPQLTEEQRATLPRRCRDLWSPHAAAGPRSAPRAHRRTAAVPGRAGGHAPDPSGRRHAPVPHRGAARRPACRRRGVRPAHRPAGREDRYEGVIGRPGCGSPTSNHQPGQLFHLAHGRPELVAETTRVTLAEHDAERAVVPELVDRSRVEPLPRLRAVPAEVGDDRPRVGERVGRLDPQHGLRSVTVVEMRERLLLAPPPVRRVAAACDFEGSSPSSVSVHACTIRATLRPNRFRIFLGFT